MKLLIIGLNEKKPGKIKQIQDDTKRMKKTMDKQFEAQEAIQKEINANWNNFANGQVISISEVRSEQIKWV